MCGIVSIVSCNRKISEKRLTGAMDRLSHRGPESEGTWLSEDGKTGLGHRRLSIVDLVTGRQPIANETGSIQVVVNGMFYDFYRIRNELAAKGHKFRTTSDSEIVIHLYEEYGIGCLTHLRGEFSFILWDERKKELFAARDRFGIKPLIYTEKDECLYMASEIKALFGAGIAAEWDKESLYQHIFVSLNQDRTLFNGINQVPPGHYLLYKGGRKKVLKYWDFNYPSEEETKELNEIENIKQLNAAIETSVKLRLDADVPVGCYLSGGIDSSAVAGIAVGQYALPLDVFTICFETAAFNEEHIAKQTSEKIGSRFNPVFVSNDDVISHFRDAVCSFEMLAENTHWVAKYLLSRHVKSKGLKTVLAGEGGDEVFAGYDFLVPEFTAPVRSESVDYQLSELICRKFENEGFPVEITRLEALNRKLGCVPVFLKNLADKRLGFKAILNDDVTKRFNKKNPFDVFIDQFDCERQIVSRHRVKKSLYLWNKSVFPNYILAAERLDMAHAVDLRLPLLDHKVVEFAAKLPPSLLLKNKREKHALREAVRPYITDTVYSRKKHAFIAPHSTVKNGSGLYEMVQDELRSTSMDAIDIFDRKKTTGLLDKLPDLDDYLRLLMEPVLLMMLSACVLHKKYMTA